MFCYQCEQTAKGTGCEISGVCGKKPEVASLQDLLLYCLMGLSKVVIKAKEENIMPENNVNSFLVKAVFATLTNVNFDEERLAILVRKAVNYRDNLKDKLAKIGNSFDNKNDIIFFTPADSLNELVLQGKKFGLKSYPAQNEDILSLKHTVLFGIKGVSAYADHAQILDYKDQKIYDYVYKTLSNIQEKGLSVKDWINISMDCGKIAFKTMEILDRANTKTYGHPIPTKVSTGHCKGKAILVSGHDLLDLEKLLKQTTGKGIYVYSHGEMLSAHGYPKLKKYSHFYGHYGSAWQNQTNEFSDFPGSILMTTNCIQRPKNSYKDNIFTSGLVAWPSVSHIQDHNFSKVINKALELPGFVEAMDGHNITVGFARNTVMSVADKVINGIKNGSIRHIFLVGGCDGSKTERSYYREFVQKIPKDCLILTLACGKYKFNDLDMGFIDDIPRLLDMGQCNDAYSAVKIAIALSEATNTEVNKLPLSLILSWYEQKAICILLALLNLGIKNIHIGPSLPAFITPNVLKTLVNKFNLTPISNPDNDIKSILG